MQDANYKKGFKFDHLWNIVNDFENFKDHVSIAKEKSRMQKMSYISSESDYPTLDYPALESPGLSLFSLNLDDFKCWWFII